MSKRRFTFIFVKARGQGPKRGEFFQLLLRIFGSCKVFCKVAVQMSAVPQLSKCGASAANIQCDVNYKLIVASI